MFLPRWWDDDLVLVPLAFQLEGEEAAVPDNFDVEK